MAQQLPEKNKLQQDDPSILHCAVNQNQQSSNKYSYKSHSASAQSSNKAPNSVRPKTAGPPASTKTQKEKKSEPVNIKQYKNWYPKNNYYYGGSPQYGRDYRYRPGSYPHHGHDFHYHSNPHYFNNSQPPKSTTSSSSMGSAAGSKKVSNHTSANSKSTAKARSAKKTGTPIDSLMHGKLAATFNKLTPTQPSPNPIQVLLQENERGTENSKSQNKIPAKKATDPAKTTAESKNRVKGPFNNHQTSKEKNQHSQNSNSSATEVEKDLKTKKKQRYRARKKKSEQAAKTSKSSTAKSEVETKPASSSENHEAGRRILDLVNGGPKTVVLSQNATPNQTVCDAKLDKEISTIIPSTVARPSTAVSASSINEATLAIEKNEKATTEIYNVVKTSLAVSDKKTEKQEKAPVKSGPKSATEQPKSANVKSSKQLTEAEKKEAERLEKLALEQAGYRMKKDHVILLKKAPSQHPRAKFFCKLCIYHMDTITLAHRHIKEKRHKKNVKDHQQDEFLRNLIIPPDDAMAEIQSLLLDKVLAGKVLDDSDLAERKLAVERLEDVIRKELPRFKVVLYGSSLSGLGFKTSDVNIDLQYPKDMTAPTVLLKVLSILNNSDMFVNVKSEFHVKLPRIDFVDKATQLRFQLSTGNELAIQTSRLLCLYAKLDERVKQLCMIHRTWAHMCKLDLQHDGALPPHAFPIMAIFFMQRKNYIPVLHEIIHEWDMEKIIASSLECSQLQWKEDELWYSPSTPPSANDDAGSDDSLDDSDSDSDYETSFVMQETSIDLTYLSSPDFDNVVCKKPDTKVKEHYNSDEFSKPVRLMEDCVGARLTLATLWLDLMRYYALQYPIESEIINIRSSHRMKREDKKWSKKRIGMLDPYSMKRNLCRSLSAQGVFTYFLGRLKAVLAYFFKPTLRNSTNSVKAPENQNTTSKAAQNSAQDEIDGCKSTTEFAEKLSSAVIKNALPSSRLEDASAPLPPSEVIQLAEEMLDEVVSDVLKTSIDGKTDDNNKCAAETSTNESAKDVEVKLSQQLQESLNISTIPDKQVQLSNPDKQVQLSNPDKQVQLSNPDEQVQLSNPDEQLDASISSDKRKYCFEFTNDVITGGRDPVKVCGLCKKEGHPRNACPDETECLRLAPLRPVSNKFRGMLDRTCYRMFNYYVPTPDEILYRDNICITLASYLKRTYNSATCMNLFGSSRNGFGFRGSDLDICMTFEGDSTAEELDCVKVIEQVAKQLRKNKDFWNILPITTAKVPIVKFFHRESGLEGDISLYNLLAQRNTSMLRCYSLIDMRCKVLGYVMKAFVKLCNIGDASKGSLSSYAYTLMVIFYLQQKDVPVLPVLQELGSESHEERAIVVDGWDSWYFNSLEKLPTVWSGYNKNKESVGELWLGLLRFYTEDFNFKHRVVSIRQKKVLSTFEKEWTSKFISIEDPFDLNHNLAAGISHKMARFIVRVFVKAREHFGTMPKEEVPRELAYFFDPMVLTDGEEAPNDRCCRICGKIGHFIRDCPKNKRNKRQDGKDGSSTSERNPVKCFYCEEEGHIKRDCPEIKKMQEQDESDERSQSPSKALSNDNSASVSSSSADPRRNTPRVQVTPSPRTRTTKTLNNETTRATKQALPVEVLFPRSLPTDPRFTAGATNQPSGRMLQRTSESDDSQGIHDDISKSSPLNIAPTPSQAPINTPLTPPASYRLYPSSSPAKAVRHPTVHPSAYFASSPRKGNMEFHGRATGPVNSSAPMHSPVHVTPLGAPIPHPSAFFQNPPMWRYPPNVPFSTPPNVASLAQIESHLMKNSPAMTSPPRDFPPTSHRQLSDMTYRDQPSVKSAHPSGPPPMPLLPGFGVGPHGLYPLYSQHSGTSNTDVLKATSSSDTRVTSPTRHRNDLLDSSVHREET